ncbi:MAG TPA: tetratricopeptide repeat protein [Thermoanaerobaculia bacterium]|nr:tetratricopeptide repeat protein [Thermoanaerobaculia bacterium]
MKFVASRAALAVAVALLYVPLYAAEGTLGGMVVDESGTPVTGAKITITTPKQKDFNSVQTTDESGRFTATVPNAKWEYGLRVERDGFSPSQTETPSANGNLSITMHPPFPGTAPPPPKVDPGVAAYNEGVELIQKGDKAGAEKKFDEAVAAKPDLAQAWKVISQLAYERKDYAKALAAGRKLLELDAKDKDLYGILMDSAQKTGDTAAAVDYKKKFVEANADNPEVNYNAGVESYTAGDYVSATASFAKAVQIKPDMANAYFWMAMSEYNQKSYPASRRDFQKYLELAPQGDQADNAKKMLEALPPK